MGRASRNRRIKNHVMGSRVIKTATAIGLALSVAAIPAAVAASPVRATSRRDPVAGRGFPGAVLVPTRSSVRLPVHGGVVDSLNWSGYAVTPGSGVDGVTASFDVPSAGLLPPGFAATWAGIGGYDTSDLIQAGVAEQSLPSTTFLGPQYYAWYELLPTVSVPLSGCAGEASCPVTPGDQIAVTIRQLTGTAWQITVDDAGKWTWTKAVTYASSGSSAEWILEAPTLDVAQTLLAPVGTVSFGPTSLFRMGTTTRTIAQGNPTMIDLSPGLINEATPSALAQNGQSFDVCAYSQTCATP